METVEKLKEVLKCIVEHIRPDGEFYYFTYTEVEEMKNYLKSEKIEDGIVEVVIKIPKKEYDYMIANPTRYNVCDDETLLYNHIKNGTVLPKGHGRLVDVDKLKERYLYMSNDDTAIEGMEYVTKGMIENAEVVIEADKEAEDETD